MSFCLEHQAAKSDEPLVLRDSSFAVMNLAKSKVDGLSEKRSSA